MMMIVKTTYTVTQYIKMLGKECLNKELLRYRALEQKVLPTQTNYISMEDTRKSLVIITQIYSLMIL